MVNSIYKNLVFNENKPVIQVLMESDFTKEIRIALKKGQTMKRHETRFPIVVQVVEGKIDFGTDQETYLLKQGDLIALSANVPHDLQAYEDSVIRLTLSKNDQNERIIDVANL